MCEQLLGSGVPSTLVSSRGSCKEAVPGMLRGLPMHAAHVRISQLDKELSVIYNMRTVCAPGRADTIAAFRLSMSQGASPAASRAAAAPLRAGEPRRSSAIMVGLGYGCPAGPGPRPPPDAQAMGSSCAGAGWTTGARVCDMVSAGAAALQPTRFVGEKRGCSSARWSRSLPVRVSELSTGAAAGWAVHVSV